VMAPRRIRFGAVEVPAMTIGPVATHDKYRKRGYAAATMNDATRYMKENGDLIGYLQGIPGFYQRFGYYPYMAPSGAKFARDQAKKASLPGRLRRMTRDDLPRVRRLYDVVTAGRTCAAARDTKIWDWLLGPGTRGHIFSGPKVILDARGRLCGYLTLDAKGRFNIREIVVRQDEASCRVALGAIALDARRREAREINLPLPWDDALAVFLRQFVGAEFLMETRASGGSVLKIVDFPALMRRLAPCFSQRWRKARTRLPGRRFTLESELGAVGFDVTSRSVHVTEPVAGPRVRVPQRWLSGFLTGYYTARDVAPRKGARVPSELLPVMEILFPAGWPFVYQGDNY